VIDKNIVIKEYDLSCKNQILKLFKKTFQKEMTEYFWNWRFEKNPFGNPIIKIAYSKDKLISNYLVHPIILHHNLNSINALFSMTTMTDPEFSGRGIGTDLANEVYKTSKLKGYDLVFGFANKNSRYMFIKKLEFDEVAQMTELTLSINKELSFASKISCLKISQFNEEHTSFFMSKNDISKIIVPRTSNYLNWRFFQHPDIKYYCYNIIDKEKILGYFVLKIFKNEKCHIVDFLLEENYECFKTVINQTIKFCNENKISKISLWVNPTLKFYHYLLKIGFVKTPMETFFITKILSDKLDPFSLNNFNNWYITMADSDIF